MNNLKGYVAKRKKRDAGFAKDYETGYSDFKIGILLKKAREEAGLSQEQLAKILHTQKSAISRIENHAKDIKLSTLENIATALGKRFKVSVS